MNRLPYIAVLFASVLLVAADKKPEKAKEAALFGKTLLKTTETSLGKFGNDLPVIVSPDARRAAYVDRRDKKWRVILDGVAGKEYDAILGRRVYFSPDSKKAVYFARRGAKEVVVINGAERGEYDTIRPNLTFSTDGKRFAYVASRGGKHFAVVDGVESDKYDTIGRLLFSPVGDRLAFRAVIGDKFLTVVNGIRGVDSDNVPGFGLMFLDASLAFSPDGKRLGYAVVRRGKWRVIVDGADLDGKEYYQVSGPIFGPHSKRLIYVVSQRGGVEGEWDFVVENGVRGKRYNRVGVAGQEGFSPDGKQFFYAATLRGRQILVVEGKEIKKYGRVRMPVFSPNSKRMAYVANRDNKKFCVVDGVEGKAQDAIGYIRFSPDSKRIAYEGSRNGKWHVVVDGTESGEYDDIGETPQFSADGKRLAFVGNRYIGKDATTQSIVVVDGVEFSVSGYVARGSLKFSADGKRIAFLAWHNEKWRCLVDGTVSEGKYDEIPLGNNLVFDKPHSLRFVAIHNNEIVSVEIAIQSK